MHIFALIAVLVFVESLASPARPVYPRLTRRVEGDVREGTGVELDRRGGDAGHANAPDRGDARHPRMRDQDRRATTSSPSVAAALRSQAPVPAGPIPHRTA